MNMRVNGNKQGGLVMFSEARIALMQEVKEHAPLIAVLSGVPKDWFEHQLPEIAAYVYIAVDGSYMPDELDVLYNMCWTKLRELRRAVIMPPTSPAIIH